MSKTKTSKKPPVKNPAKTINPKTKRGINPKKPGTDPDQTPTREIQKQPVANPNQNTK
jgi:hypothetical protein